MAGEALVKNAADEDQVKVAKEKELRGRELELADFEWLLSEKRGRRVLWRIFEFAGMHRLSFAGDSHATTAFNEGMKNVGQKLLADLMEARPEAYVEMMGENRKEK